MVNEYKHIFSKVKNIINKRDPAGLLNQGAPEDEYDEEVQKIIPRLRTCDNVEKVKELIYNIFTEDFGEETSGNIDLYSGVAEEIFEESKAYRSQPKP